MLASLTILACIATLPSLVGAYPTSGSGLDRMSLSFASAQTYSLVQEYDDKFTKSQELFAVHAGGHPTSTVYSLKARPTTIYRPVSHDIYQAARLRSLHLLESQPVEWEGIDVLGPDVEDQHTLSQLGRMTGNAYAQRGQKNWYDLDPQWNVVSEFPLNCVLSE